jgi:hypothetical protein
MADDTERTQPDWEAIDEEEEGLDADDTVDETVEKLLCEDGVFFYEFGKVVQSRCYTMPLTMLTICGSGLVSNQGLYQLLMSRRQSLE